MAQINIRQTICQGGIPFKIATHVNQFFCESNIKTLQESIKEADEGKFVSKSIEELKEME
jgi:DNA-damage-inducible protein J